MGLLDGNVTLITGGGSGLGRAIVGRFVTEGARVAVLERAEDKAEQLRNDLGDAVVVEVGDVRSPADNARAVAAALAEFGHLDTFVGNAGVWDYLTRLDAMTGEQLATAFDELFAVNVKGYLLGANAAIPALRASRGSIIFTLSNAAFLPGGGGPLYTASKHAGVGLVRQLAYELETEVRVNAVAPGGMITDLRGLPSLGQDERRLQAMIDAAGGKDALVEQAGRAFFPEPDDYVLAYVVLASAGSRTTTGAIYENHGILSAPPAAR